MRIPLRPFATALLGVAAVTCIDAPSAPSTGSGRSGAIAFAPVFSQAATRTAALLGQFGISYDHVRIVVVRPPSDTVRDTTIAFANGDAATNLDLTVTVRKDGELFDASIDYVGDGGTVFHGHGQVRAHAIDEPAPESPAIILNYAGPGANAARITIQPHDLTLLASDSTRTLAVAAVDSSGAAVDPPPFAWTTSDGTIATITSHGTLQPLGHRGSITVTATTVTGLSDNVAATLTLPATSIALVTGGGQTGVVGTLLANPVVVQVSAADGVGVAGVNVVFGAPAGGSVNPTSAVTDANGRASTTLKLGVAAGLQSFVATALQFNVAIPATASAGSAAAMIFVDPTTLAPLAGGPSLVTLVGAALPATTAAVKVTDANGNPVPNAPVDVDMRSSTQSLATAQLLTDAQGIARLGKLAIPTIVQQTPGTLTFVISNPSLSAGSTLTLPVEVLGVVATLQPVNAAVSTIVGSPLGSSLYPTFVALDANGAPVPNDTVTFSAQGICTFGGSPGTTLTTDSAGRASLSPATFTLPVSTPGSCLVEATTTSGIDIPGAFASVVVAPSGVAAWLGGTTDWATGSNWSSGTVPTTSQAVFISAFVLTHPTLQAATSVGDVSLEAGGFVDLNGNTLTVSGNLTGNGGSIVDNAGTGALILAKGSPGTIDAVVSASVTIGSGSCNGTSYTVAGMFTVNGSLTLNCPLDLGATQLAVLKDLIVQNSGTLEMTQPNVVAVVKGNATFGGASEIGLLTTGTLEVGGNFSQLGTVSAASFSADSNSNFLVQLIGTAPQTVSFATPGAGASTSRFADLLVPAGTSVTFSTAASMTGTLTQNGTISALTGDTLTFLGPSNFNPGSTTNVPVGAAATFMATTVFSGVLTLDGGMAVVLPGTVTFDAGSTVSGAGTLSLLQGATCSVSATANLSGLLKTILTPPLCTQILP
jgi:hypothetical protein